MVEPEPAAGPILPSRKVKGDRQARFKDLKAKLARNGKAKENVESEPQIESETPDGERMSDDELFRDPDELDTIRDAFISLWLAIKKSNKLYLSVGLLLALIGIILLYGYWDYRATLPQEVIDQEQEEAKYYSNQYPLGAEGQMEGLIDSIVYFPNLTRQDYTDMDYNFTDGGPAELTPSPSTAGDFTLSTGARGKRLAFTNLTITNTFLDDVKLSKIIFTNVTIRSTFFSSGELSKVVFIDSRLEDVTFINLELERVGFFNTSLTNVNFINTRLERLLVEDCMFLGGEFKNSPLSLTRFTNSTFNQTWFTSENPDKPLVSQKLVFDSTEFDNVVLNNTLFEQVIDPRVFEAADGYTFMNVEGLTVIAEGNLTEDFSDDIYIWFEFRVEEHGSATWVSTQYDSDYFSYAVVVAQPDTVDLTLEYTAAFALVTFLGGALLVYAIGGRLVVMALAKFFTPFIIGIAGIGLLFLLLAQSDFIALGKWMVLYFLPPLGKESVIPAAIVGDNLNWVVVALAIAFIDIVTGLFLAWNFDFAKRIPLIGAFIRRLERKGTDLMEKKPWVEKFTFLGIVLFVIVPFQGSGAVGGTITGRALGMKPMKVWAAVICGALLGCFAIAIGVVAGLDFAAQIGYLKLLLIIMAMIVFAGLVWIFRHWEMVEDELRPLYEDIKSKVSLESASTTFVKTIDLSRLRNMSGGNEVAEKDLPED